MCQFNSAACFGGVTKFEKFLIPIKDSQMNIRFKIVVNLYRSNLSQSYHSGSGVSWDCFWILSPVLTFVLRPGKLTRCLPSPIIWPAFKFFVLPFPANLPRPLFLPALLTEVTLSQSSKPVPKMQRKEKKMK